MADEPDRFVDGHDGELLGLGVGEEFAQVALPWPHDDEGDSVDENAAGQEPEEAGGEVGFAGLRNEDDVGQRPEETRHHHVEGGGFLELETFATGAEDDVERRSDDEGEGDELDWSDGFAEEDPAEYEGDDRGDLGEEGDFGGLVVFEGAVVWDRAEEVHGRGSEEDGDLTEADVEDGSAGAGQHGETDDGFDRDIDDGDAFATHLLDVGVDEEVVDEAADRLTESGNNRQQNPGEHKHILASRRANCSALWYSMGRYNFCIAFYRGWVMCLRDANRMQTNIMCFGWRRSGTATFGVRSCATMSR